MASDDIQYSGPSKDIRPTIGGNPEVAFRDNLSADANGGYDNIDWLRDMLDTLIQVNGSLIDNLSENLNQLALQITPSDSDDRLRAAFRSEWPDPNSTPPNFVPYSYYKALTTRSTAGAAYIQKRWEEAVRDITGTSAFDIIDLANVVRSEAILVKGFLDTHVGTVDDSSERRTVELFQDWAASALQRTSRYEQIAQTKESDRRLPDAEVESSNPEDAVKYQALFKVKLNQLNLDLDKVKSGLKKNFAEYSDTFYNRFLGPALDFRLQVSRQIYPSNSVLGREAGRVQGSMDANFGQLLTDQLRRNATFNQTVDTLLETLLERDTYRSYVAQLSVVGKALEAREGRNKLASMSLEVIESLPVMEDWGHATPIFGADHNALSGRENPLAHPQYFLIDGGELEGDMELADGVLIDGIRPSTHEHSGTDGSAKIKGSNILGGTLGTDAVDTVDKPPKPTNLRLVGTSVRMVPPGISMVNATVSWEGDEALHYEVQISRPE